MEYDGLCSHCALVEKITNEDEGLTLEQVEAKGVEMEQRRIDSVKNRDPVKLAATQKKSKAKLKAAKKYYCDDSNESFDSSSLLARHKTTQTHINKVAGVVKVVKVPQLRRWTANNKASKRYYCSICNSTFETSWQLKRHKLTKKHLDKAAAVASLTSSC